jgi:DNA-binding NtrC family response regulator
MRVADLDLRELLSFDPRGGVMHFGGERVLLFDALALGVLRRELIESVGVAAARGILTRFGYAHGRRVAETMRKSFPWESEREWQLAGGRLHMLQGMVEIELPRAEKRSGPEPLAEAIWHESYEAEQHLLHLGQAAEPVCWTLTGFASGYLSFTRGRVAYALERRCRGKGDAVCRLEARFAEDWAAEPGFDEQLRYYRKQCVDAEVEQASAALRKADQRLRARQQALAHLAGEALEVSGIVARGEPMRRVLDLARRIAKVDSTALVTGESGVGKERIAKLIHDESSRAGKPFLAINCGAVAESLLESELFGHAKGAFTSADRDRPGLFEAAAGGTLFLDEVGELPSAMQVKLLRVIQEREVRRVGENKSRPVDVRLVAATNRELSAEVAAGRFRQDLYYRLRVIELRVPPLRERREDVLPLARIFLQQFCEQMGRKLTGFTPAAADLLQRHPWPGNVRELQNAVERAVALSDGRRVDAVDLPEELHDAGPRLTARGRTRPLAVVEREAILSAVEAEGGNKTRAAEALQIGLATINRKMRQYAEEAEAKA